MRRFILYFLIYWIGVLLQFGLVRYVSLAGLSPNYLLVFVVFTGITRGALAGELIGFAWGLTWDVLEINVFGSHALIFTCLGYLSGQLSRKWNESKIVTQVVLVGIASVLYWTGYIIVSGVFSSVEFKWGINYIMIFQPILNMLMAPVIFFCGRVLMEFIDSIDY